MPMTSLAAVPRAGSPPVHGGEYSEEGVRRERCPLHLHLGHSWPSQTYVPEPIVSPVPSFISCLLSTHPPTQLPVHLSNLPYLPPNQFTFCVSISPTIHLVNQSSPSSIYPLIHLLSHPSPIHSLNPHSFIHFPIHSPIPLNFPILCTSSIHAPIQMSIHSLCIHPKNISSAQEKHTSPLLGGRKGFTEEDDLSGDIKNV